eukprot:gene6962-biopygen8763
MGKQTQCFCGAQDAVSTISANCCQVLQLAMAGLNITFLAAGAVAAVLSACSALGTASGTSAADGLRRDGRLGQSAPLAVLKALKLSLHMKCDFDVQPVYQAEIESQQGSVKAAGAQQHPLLAFLATPKLPPELAHRSKSRSSRSSSMSFSNIRVETYDRVSRSQYYQDNFAGLTSHERHQKLLSHLPKDAQQVEAGNAAAAAAAVTDEDVLRQHHRFLRGPADDDQAADSWGVRLAKRYYDRLFKEFAIADMSRYKESKIGMRWRTKAEVVSGKGQFCCGSKGCDEQQGLASYEVNFAYVEAGQPKQALVKLRVCPTCAHKLNYRREKQYKQVPEVQLQQQAQCKGKEPHGLGQEALQHMISGKHDKITRNDVNLELGSKQRSDDHHLSKRRRIQRRSQQGQGHVTADLLDYNTEHQQVDCLPARADGAAGVELVTQPSPAVAGGAAAATSMTAAADCAAKSQAKALTDADIDAWLDNMFTA